MAAPQFDLFLFDNNTFGIDSESKWLEGNKDELSSEYIKNEGKDKDSYMYYLILKFSRWYLHY